MKFCPFCEAKKSQRHEFQKWKMGSNTTFAKTMFGTDITLVPCLLHAKIRITEKLLKLAISAAKDRNVLGNLFEAVEKVLNQQSYGDLIRLV